MSSHSPRFPGAARPGVVRASHPVAPPLRFAALALVLFGCTDTYCQTGPKYGTQCYAVQNDPGGGQPVSAYRTNAWPFASNNSQRGPNGQKP